MHSPIRVRHIYYITYHLSKRLLTNVSPSRQNLDEGIVMRQPLMLVVVHNGLISLEGGVDVHPPHLPRLQNDGVSRQIQLGILSKGRAVLLLVDLYPVAPAHGDLTLDGPDGGLLLVGRLAGLAREARAKVVLGFLGDGRRGHIGCR